MSKCARCGARVWAMELDDAGLCARCIENEKDADQKRELIRKQNYQHFLAHEVEHKSQRIFDAFIKKYPDALITGISVQDGGSKLLIYLDGNPMYYATFNPLTNDVDLVKYDASQETGTSFQQPQKTSTVSSSRPGCLSFLLKCTIIVSIILIVSYILIEIAYYQNSDHPVISTISPHGTATPRPTAAPALDDPVAWGIYYAEKYMPDDMELDTVETSISVGETYLVIACNMEQMWDSDDYIRSASELICKVGPDLLNVEGYDHVTFLFYGPFIDQYGNDIQSLGIRAMYSREELNKINFDYFYNTRFSKPEGVIKTTNHYIIHPSYLD